jgi:hypothetical protein
MRESLLFVENTKEDFLPLGGDRTQKAMAPTDERKSLLRG